MKSSDLCQGVVNCAGCGQAASSIGPLTLWCPKERCFYCRRCTGGMLSCPKCGTRMSALASMLPYVGLGTGSMMLAMFLILLASTGFNYSWFGWEGHLNPSSIGVLMVESVTALYLIGGVGLLVSLRRARAHTRSTSGHVLTLPPSSKPPQLPQEEIRWFPNSYPRQVVRKSGVVALAFLPPAAALTVGLWWWARGLPAFAANFVDAYGSLPPLIAGMIAVIGLTMWRRMPRRLGISASGLHFDFVGAPPGFCPTYIAWSEVIEAHPVRRSRSGGLILRTRSGTVRAWNVDKQLVPFMEQGFLAWRQGGGVTTPPAWDRAL